MLPNIHLNYYTTNNIHLWPSWEKGTQLSWSRNQSEDFGQTCKVTITSLVALIRPTWEQDLLFETTTDIWFIIAVGPWYYLFMKLFLGKIEKKNVKNLKKNII